MRHLPWLCLLFLILACSEDDAMVTKENEAVSLIAFGSCANPFLLPGEMKPFSRIYDLQPDLYIGMGDNMYSDVPGLEDQDFYPLFINFNYPQLRDNAHFRKIYNHIPLIATWDDHDYGLNNAGRDFPHKEVSKQSFMDFYRIPEDAGMRSHGGIYDAYYYGSGEQRLQILLLDTRWDLDVISSEPLEPTTDETLHILGEEQWAWLAEELREPAALRIIGSSTQFGIEANGWEAWANYPHEVERMFETIAASGAEGVFFLSGDVHYSEVSRREYPGLYPIYDFTSSGITHSEGSARSNMYRVGEAYVQRNFGTLVIDWEADPVTVTYRIHDKNGVVVQSHTIDRDEISY